MEEPSPRSSRLALAGGLAATLLIGGAGFLLGRGTTDRTQMVTAPRVDMPTPRPAPESPALDAVLDRSDLIALAAKAADAAGAGRDPGPEVAKAGGRRFELRLPFGCDGPSEEDSEAAMRWRYDEKEEVLRIRVEPTTWTARDWWSGAAPTGIQAIEGFWIGRPWTASEACAASGGRAAPVGTEPVTLPGQTLALGQIFYSEGRRGAQRDGRPYEAVIRVPEGDLEVSAGFRVKLSGRLARMRDGGPVRCRQPAGPEQRPICLISVLMDEIAIENPAGDVTLATWSPSGGELRDP